MRRADAIESVKKVFLATNCKAKSAAAAIATVLFDNAKTSTDPRQGLTHRELLAEASGLWKSWGKTVDLGYETINTELHRLGKRLPRFLKTQNLSLFCVTNIVGPTNSHRGDDEERVFLRVDFAPQPDASALGSEIGTGIVEQLPPEQRRGVEQAIADGAKPQVGTMQISGKTVVVVLLTVAGAGASIYYAMRPHLAPPPAVKALAIPMHQAKVIPIVFPEHLDLTRTPGGDRPTVRSEPRPCQGGPLDERIEAYVLKKCDTCLVYCISAGAIKDAGTVIELNYGDDVVDRVPASSAVRFTGTLQGKSLPVKGTELYAAELNPGVLVYYIGAYHEYPRDGPRTVTVRLLGNDSGASSVLRDFARRFFVGAKARVATKGKYILPH